jgi:hypothetical protein
MRWNWAREGPRKIGGFHATVGETFLSLEVNNRPVTGSYAMPWAQS